MPPDPTDPPVDPVDPVDPADPPTDPPADPTPTDPPAPADLGDAGKKALEAERTARKAAEKAARDAQDALTKLQQAQMSDQERAVAEARAEGEKAASAKYEKELLRARLVAAGAGKVKDTVLRRIDLDSLERDAEGNVTDEEIANAIADLVDTPAGGATPLKPGGADGGARGRSAPGQLTRKDLETMSTEEIVKADRDGRLNEIQGLPIP